MKKLFALMLTLALALSLTACGGSKEETPADEGGETGEEAVDYTTMSDDELKAAITTVTEGTLTVATSRTLLPMSSTLWTRTRSPSWPVSIWIWPSTSPTTWA